MQFQARRSGLRVSHILDDSQRRLPPCVRSCRTGSLSSAQATSSTPTNQPLPVDERLGVPVNSLALVTVVQMLLGLINLGSSSAFTAFVSVGVQALALAYGIPIGISLFCGRKEVNKAR